MKLKKIFLAFLLGIFVFSSCSNNEDVLNDGANTKATSSVDSTAEQKIVAYVNNFVNMVEASSTPSSRAINSIMTVSNISKKTYSGISTRTGNSKIANVYTLEFTKNGKKGFAIASMDSSINRVFAYTENGNLSDTIYNVPLHEVLASIPDYCIKALKKESVITKALTRSDNSTKEVVVDNMVKTEWYQGSPYNDLYPSVGSLTHAYAGCGIIAVAQAIAYYGSLGVTSQNSLWPYSQLTASSTIWPSSSLASTVASYVFSFTNNMDPSYYEDGTSVSKNAPIAPLDAYNIRYYYRNDNLSTDKAWITINSNNLIIATGNNKRGHHVGAGHMWLYTGAIASYSAGEFQDLLALYANWGWGGTADGWYYSDWEEPRTSDNYRFIKDNRQYYIEQKIDPYF